MFLLAQAGVPLTSGFLAKFYVIDAAVEAGSYWLGLVAMLSAVISAFLYLRIVLVDVRRRRRRRRGRRRRPRPRPRIQVPLPATVAIALAAVVATIGIGLVPDPLTETARDATPDLVADARDRHRRHPSSLRRTARSLGD